MTKSARMKVHIAKRMGDQMHVTLHQLDPHEPGENEFTKEAPRSGEAKFKLLVTDPEAMPLFEEGKLVTVSISG